MSDYIKDWNSIAHEYAPWLSDDSGPGGAFTKLVTESVIDEMMPVSNNVILDLGCGEGHLSRELNNLGASVRGIDGSNKMIDLANSYATGIKYRVGDITGKLPYADTTFDQVVANMVLMDVHDLDGVLSEVYRVLRRKGRFIFSIVHPCFEGVSLVHDKPTLMFSEDQRYLNEYSSRKLLSDGFFEECAHFHRPLNVYVNSLIESGFVVSKLKETVINSSEIKDDEIKRLMRSFVVTANNLVICSEKR